MWAMNFPDTRSLIPVTLAAALVLLCAAPARADLTCFLGVTTTPTSRTNGGFALGTGFVIFAFEFEYAATKEDLTSTQIAPALKTYMINGLIQTPVPIVRTQFYGTVGGGVYHETLSTQPAGDQTNIGTNIGGGAKINLVGPLRLRLDYRVFTLQGGARHTPVQRFYAGINLKF
jgi:opacity protein-like surface antigen